MAEDFIFEQNLSGSSFISPVHESKLVNLINNINQFLIEVVSVKGYQYRSGKVNIVALSFLGRNDKTYDLTLIISGSNRWPLFLDSDVGVAKIVEIDLIDTIELTSFYTYIINAFGLTEVVNLNLDGFEMCRPEEVHSQFKGGAYV